MVIISFNSNIVYQNQTLFNKFKNWRKDFGHIPILTQFLSTADLLLLWFLIPLLSHLKTFRFSILYMFSILAKNYIMGKNKLHNPRIRTLKQVYCKVRVRDAGSRRARVRATEGSVPKG